MTLHSKFRFGRVWFWTFGRFLWLSFLGIRNRENRRLFMSIGRSLGYAEVKPRLAKHPLTDLIRDNPPVKLSSIEREDAYQVTPFELMTLASIVAGFAPKQLFEIGTFDGRTTLNLWQNAPDDAKVFTIDLPPDQQTHSEGKGQSAKLKDVSTDRIIQLFGDSHQFDFGPYASQIDLVFVDANHAYEAVVKDSQTALAMTEGRRALVIWHDYEQMPGVTRAVNELIDRLPKPRFFGQIQGTSLACLLRENGSGGDS